MPPLVSITMSAYNVAPFLRACLECVINQTLRDVEIICVNDGSTDATLQILREYQARDPRFHVIDKQANEGLAVARNAALSVATGKYVGFVDTDDLLERDTFEKACRRAEESRGDLLIWDYTTFTDAGEVEARGREPSALRSLDPTDKIALLLRPAFMCTKLIRTDRARELGIAFPRGLTYQDIPVHWKLVTQLDRIALLPERLYHYRQTPTATTHGRSWRRADVATVMDLVKQFLDGAGLYQTYRDVFLRKQLELLCGMHDVIHPALRPRALRLIQERLGADQWRYVQDRRPLRWQTRDFYLAMRGSLRARARRALWLSARTCYRTLRRGTP